jgi:hypothetical protein
MWLIVWVNNYHAYHRVTFELSRGISMSKNQQRPNRSIWDDLFGGGWGGAGTKG